MRKSLSSEKVNANKNKDANFTKMCFSKIPVNSFKIKGRNVKKESSERKESNFLKFKSRIENVISKF